MGKNKLRGIAVSVIAHIGVIGWLVMVGMWDISKISGEVRDQPATFIVRGGSVKSPPPGAREKPKSSSEKRVSRAQPATRPPAEIDPAVSAAADGDSGDGVGDGGGSGEDGNGLGEGGSTGIGIGLPIGHIVPKVAKPKTPKLLSEVVLKANFLAGNQRILPPQSVRVVLLRESRGNLTGLFQLCINRSGQVSSVKTIRSTGYPRYDRVLVQGIRTWRYRPYFVGGKPQRACAPLTIRYQMR